MAVWGRLRRRADLHGVSGSAQPEITLSMISCCRLADAAGCAALRENTAFYQYWDKNIEALTALELM